MGCHCSQTKEFEQEEETLIVHFEQCLGFGNHTAGHICTQVQVLTLNERLNWNRLRQLTSVLNLNVEGLQSSEEPIARLYEGLKEGKEWKARQISLLGVLLGQGKAAVKAPLLFRLYDPDDSGVLSIPRIEEMLQDLCAIAFTHLPLFAQRMLGNSDSAVLLGSYIDHLAEAKQATCLFLARQIAEGPVSAQDFVIKAQECAKSMFSAKLLRTEGLRHYKNCLRSLQRLRASTI